MLIEYIRDKNRNPIGVLVALPDRDGGIRIGWSKCNISKRDRFDRDIGLILAIGRASPISLIYVRKKHKLKQMPRQVRKQLERHFLRRASRYYNADLWQQCMEAYNKGDFMTTDEFLRSKNLPSLANPQSG